MPAPFFYKTSTRNLLYHFLRQLSADKSDVDVIAVAIAAGLIAAIGVTGFQEGRGKRRVLYAAPALVA